MVSRTFLPIDAPYPVNVWPLPEKSKEPKAAPYLVNDITTEALAPILNDNPRGVRRYRNGLAGLIGGFDRYASSGKADEAM